MGPKKLSPEEKIVGLKDATVGDFWAWAYSDILTNIRRGMFAEFLVGSKLGVVDSVPPAGWEYFDFLYGDKKIEVKSSAYVQGWDQQGGVSVPSFGIAERWIWDENINDWLPEPQRPADCYVFCLYAEKKDRSVASILDMNKWDFYVVPTRRINETLGAQKTVRLSGVESMTKKAVKIEQLKERVDLALRED